MSFSAILFDLDGTLIDSAPDVRRALNRVLEPLGRRPHTVAEVKDLVGHGARVLMERALAATGEVPSADEIDGLTAAFLADYAENPVVHSTVFPGARESVARLRDAGVPLAICTNKPAKTTEPVMEELGLLEFFPVIVCGDDVEHRKPDGRHVLHTIERAGGDPADSVMIGDSENDIYAARDARVPSVAVTFGYCHVPHAELGADALIDAYDELEDALRAIAAGRRRAAV